MDQSFHIRYPKGGRLCKARLYQLTSIPPRWEKPRERSQCQRLQKGAPGHFFRNWPSPFHHCRNGAAFVQLGGWLGNC